jgi:RND family efflux transporter MFP subunit
MIKKYSLKLTDFFRKRTKLQIFFIILSAIAVVFIGIKAFSDNEAGYEFTTAEKRTLIQEISVTGNVKPASSVDLAFEKLGKISRIFADIGDRIKTGSIIVSLDNSELTTDLNQADATVKIAEANLATAKAGARPEELAIETAKLQSSQADLSEARAALVNSLESSYATIYDTAKNKIDFMFATQEGGGTLFRLNFAEGDLVLRTTVEAERNELNNNLISWRASLNNLNDASDLQAYSIEAKKVFRLEAKLITDLSNLLNTFTPGVYPSKTTIDSYRAYLSAGQTAINTGSAGFDAAAAAYSAALSAKEVASRSLTLTQAGSTAEEIAAEEARLDQAEANAAKIRSQLIKSNLYSPIDGIVTKQDAKIGEFVSAGQNIVSVISDAEFEIESNIPEADIAKIQLNDSAKVTLDAYGNDVVFKATVIRIDPAEIIIDGVPTYKTVFKFTEKDDRVKSGMTANIDILTENKPDSLVVPQRAVITKEGRKIVRVFKNNEITEVLIETGIRGSDGYIEILNGLQENDRVIISEKK